MKESRVETLTKQFSGHAGEPVEVQEIGGSIYVFGTELATLRIFKRYAECNNVSQGYSANRETFFFCFG